MLCQMCQINEANFFQTKSINGVTSKSRYCSKCAAEKGIIQKSSEPLSFHQFVAGLVNEEKFKTEQKMPTNSIYNCTGCGLSFSNFKLQGKFGCGDCYVSFKEHIPVIIQHFQRGNIIHKGKIPIRFKRKDKSDEQVKNNKNNHTNITLEQIAEQKKLLMNHVLEEKFELAALTRDKIRSLEATLREVRDNDQE